MPSEAHRAAQGPDHKLKVRKTFLSLMSAEEWKPRGSEEKSIMPGSQEIGNSCPEELLD